MRNKSPEKPIDSFNVSSGLPTAIDLTFTNIILKHSKKCEMLLLTASESTSKRLKQKEMN